MQQKDLGPIRIAGVLGYNDSKVPLKVSSLLVLLYFLKYLPGNRIVCLRNTRSLLPFALRACDLPGLMVRVEVVQFPILASHADRSPRKYNNLVCSYTLNVGRVPIWTTNL